MCSMQCQMINNLYHETESTHIIWHVYEVTLSIVSQNHNVILISPLRS